MPSDITELADYFPKRVISDERQDVENIEVWDAVKHCIHHVIVIHNLRGCDSCTDDENRNPAEQFEKVALVSDGHVKEWCTFGGVLFVSIKKPDSAHQ